eukprot:9195-Rhodomonas_salina.2
MLFATRCAVLSEALLAPQGRGCSTRRRAVGAGGQQVSAYARPTRCPVLTWRMVTCSCVFGMRHPVHMWTSRCPVLSSRMVLSAYASYAMPGTDMAYDMAYDSVEANTAMEGGGVYVAGGIVRVRGCVCNNSAEGSGTNPYGPTQLLREVRY